MSNPEATPLDAFIEALKAMDTADRAAVIERFDSATPEEIRELLRTRKERNCARCGGSGWIESPPWKRRFTCPECKSKGTPDAA